MNRTTFATLGLTVAAFLTAPLARAQDSNDAQPAPAPAPEPAPAPAPAPAAELPNSPPSEVVSAPEEKKDSGLGLEWLWINGGVSGTASSLTTFGESNLALTHTSQNATGATFDIGAGVRLLFLSAGIRVRSMPIGATHLLQFDGEVALHGRMGNLDTYIGARGGYMFPGSLDPNTLGSAASNGGQPPNVSIHGENIGFPILGFDYYFNHYFSIGAEASVDFLIIQRPPAPAPAAPALPAGLTCPPPAGAPQQVVSACMTYTTAVTSYNALLNSPLYKESGSSFGAAISGGVHAGLHF